MLGQVISISIFTFDHEVKHSHWYARSAHFKALRSGISRACRSLFTSPAMLIEASAYALSSMAIMSQSAVSLAYVVLAKQILLHSTLSSED